MRLVTRGWTAAAVGRALERDGHTIGKWTKAFAEGGPRALVFEQTGGSPRVGRGATRGVEVGGATIAVAGGHRIIQPELASGAPVCAARTGARIFFADEAHFQADADLRGKWVLRGEPALVDSTSPRRGEKVSYYSAVCLETGEVEVMELEGNSNAATSASFLKQLRAQHPSPRLVKNLATLSGPISPHPT